MSTSFRAMNTDITVVAPTLEPAAEQALGQRVAADFESSEQAFSRFRPNSELTRLNTAPPGPVVVSSALFDALQRARHYWQLTDGWFDPTIGGALKAAGYDRSFVAGGLDRAEGPRPSPGAGRFGDVLLEAPTRSVTLPMGVQLDFGGFVKGWTVDRAAKRLPTPAALDAGGDAFLRGGGTDGDGWLVDIEDPDQVGRCLLTFALTDRAVATSGRNHRRWLAGGREQHHLIDPRTGEPSATDLLQVTVAAASAELADVLAKTAFLQGLEGGRRFIGRFDDVAAVFVGADRRVTRTGEMEVVDVAA